MTKTPKSDAAPALKTDVITFVSDINQNSLARLVGITEQAKKEGSGRIIINISSMGGGLQPAFAAYHYLRSLGTLIETHNIGTVESAAVLLFLAADIRRASPHSRFLLHPFNWTFNGEIAAPVLRNALNSLDFDARRYGDIFNERTQGAQTPVDVFQCLNKTETIIGAVAAASAGICSAVADVNAAPVGARIWSVTPPVTT
jgi:ATP-dependent protease ClpP protease subunit